MKDTWDMQVDQIVCCLYDGGWRAEDREDIIAEYDLTEEQADQVCNMLQTLAEANQETEPDTDFEWMLKNWDATVNLMDDEIREAIHRELAPCGKDEFLAEYLRRHEARYGEEFTVN